VVKFQVTNIKKHDVTVKRLNSNEHVIVYNGKAFTLDEIGSALNAYEVKKSHIKKAKQKAAARKKQRSLDSVLVEDQGLKEIQ
jgi:hypothetical protein